MGYDNPGITQRDRARDFLIEVRLGMAARARRITRAWRYATGTLTEADASLIICECEAIAGTFALTTLDVEGVMEEARTRWAEADLIEGKVRQACRRVASNYGSDSAQIFAATGWALDLAAEWASNAGIVLTELDPWPEEA